jgi:calcineurin-like phosphoesterase family protein
MATIAIGDVHGNHAALEDLLAKVVPELQATDTLVFLGDVIDRGHQTREVVERIVQLRRQSAFAVVALMGNHEQWMLKSLHNPCSHSWLLGMGALDTMASYSPRVAQTMREALEQAGLDLFEEKLQLPYELFFNLLPRRHLEFFEGLQLFHHTSDVVCVHGGMDLEGRTDETDAEAFIWGPEGFPEGYKGQHRVVYGHHNDAVEDANGWPQPSVNENQTYGIDSIATGVLTAMRFPGGRIYQSARHRDT